MASYTIRPDGLEVFQKSLAIYFVQRTQWGIEPVAMYEKDTTSIVFAPQGRHRLGTEMWAKWGQYILDWLYRNQYTVKTRYGRELPRDHFRHSFNTQYNLDEIVKMDPALGFKRANF